MPSGGAIIRASKVRLLGGGLCEVSATGNSSPGSYPPGTIAQPAAWPALAACLAAYYAVYFWAERCFLKAPTPASAWPLLIPVALILPFQILFFLFTNNTIQWRGQKIRVKRNGEYELLD